MKSIFILLAFTGIIAMTHAQTVTVNGTVTDAKTGEVLVSANVYDKSTLQGSPTNLYGFYSIKMSSGQCEISVSYTGYKTTTLALRLANDTTVHFKLEPSIELGEVTVSGQQAIHNVQHTQTGMVQLSPAETEKLPVLLGESDIIKALQLTPGVQGGNEGSSGFYVRGGGPDQNLILLDGVPVYNVNHLFGFLSVFNSDAIRNVTLIKGGFPSRYGGRLSSVLDIRMKEGNNQEFKGEGSVGVVSSKLTLEGPIVKDRTSFMVSGRRSYIDLLSYPFQMMANNQSADSKTWAGYYLQDFNGKINHRINERQKLFFSIYTGKDKFYAKDRSTYESYNNDQSYRVKNKDNIGLQWGNFTSALRWNYVVTNDLFCNATATVSDYKFEISEAYSSESSMQSEDYDQYFSYYSQIRDYGLKADFDYSPNAKHYIRFGAGNTLQRFSPGITVMRDRNSYNPTDTTYGNQNIQAMYAQVYAEDDMSLGYYLKINAGLHFSSFSIQKHHYTSLEPRLSARVLVTPDLSIKASYASMQQYLHLLGNSSFGLPTDLWVPATAKIKPQKSWQTSLSATYAVAPGYELTVEGYYKKMDNLADYAEGASFFELNQGNWEDLVTSGQGQSYGGELFLQKSRGPLTGWIGYTLSWSNRQFDDVSFGQTFPYKYDSRHDISIVAMYKLNDRLDFGATWVYRTGYRFTLEDERFLSPIGMFNEPMSSNYGTQGTVDYFEKRNNYKMPDYHRLDIGLNMHKQKKRHLRTWSFGVYNAYAKKNAFITYVSTDYDWNTDQATTELKQLSLFNFIPYLRWSAKF